MKAARARPMPLARRACGPCQACCRDLKIDAPDLKKKAGVLCGHYTGSGCAIYARRPAVCRGFLCGWRLFEELGDDWRPDLAGALIVKRDAAAMPKAYHGAEYGISLVITGGEAAIRRPGFAEYVAATIRRGIAVEMSAGSPATLLNRHLDGAAAGTNPNVTREVLVRLYRMLKARRWKRGILMLWHLYRLEVERQRALMEKKPNKTI